MTAAPFMNLYIGDYLADTTHLTTEEHGAYLLLLMAMWRAGGKLPRDDKKLAKLALLTDERWLEIGPTLMDFFTIRGGIITQKRLAKEASKYREIISKRKKAGRASAAKRANEIKENGSTHVQHVNHKPKPESKEEKEPPIAPKGAKAISLRKAHVEAAWAATPPTAKARTSRSDIETALKAAARRGHQPEDVIAGLEAYYRTQEATREDGRFAKGAHRIIAGDRWKDFAETVEETIPTDPNATWRHRINAYLNGSRYWNTTDWGSRPGQEGCEAPPEIVAEFGIGGAEVLPFPLEERAA